MTAVSLTSRSSPRSAVPPRFRIVGSVAAIFLIVLLPYSAWRWQLFWLIPLVALSRVLSLTLKELGTRALLILPFIALLCMGMLSQPEPGVRILNLCLKSFLSLWVMSLLIRGTTVPDLIQGLRELHVPRLLVDLLAFLMRYLHVFTAEWQRMQHAREARMFQGGGARKFLSFAQSLGVLFIRAYERAEDVHRAMLARGYRPPDHDPK